MESLPVFIRMEGRRVLVAGDGEPALAKLRLVAKTPADILWLAPTGAALPEDLADHARIDRWVRGFEPDDLAGVALVYASMASESEDRRIAAAARAASIPVNIVDRPHLCDFTTPAIVDRDPILVAISTGGAAPAFARRLRGMIEAMVPPAMGPLLRRLRDLRGTIATLLPQSADRRRFWDRLFDAPDPAALGSLDDAALMARLEQTATETVMGGGGLVQLVGAGPGDPELLTLKAQRALQQADVIVYDRLVSDAVRDFARRDAELVYAGKQRGDHGRGQDFIHDEMIRHARAGRRVARLKSGDPFVFGRAGEEISALRAAGIEVEVIPGITAVAGCAATAQLPLTHREHASAVTLVTGHVAAGGHLEWRALAGPDRTLAVYMGVSTAEDIAVALLSDGVSPDLPVAIVENGTRPEERRLYGRLIELPGLVAREAVQSPALILIGQVAAEARDWPAEELAPVMPQAPALAAAE